MSSETLSRPSCPVCQEMMFHDAYALLECSHVFHPHCIRRWLNDYRQDCPVCRKAVCAGVLADLNIKTCTVNTTSDSPVYVPPTYLVPTTNQTSDVEEISFDIVFEDDFIPTTNQTPDEEEFFSGRYFDVESEEPSHSSGYSPVSPGYIPPSYHISDANQALDIATSPVIPDFPGDDLEDTSNGGVYFPDLHTSSTVQRPWQDILESLTTDDGHTNFSTSSRKIAYFSVSTCEFLKKLYLTDEEYDRIIFYKRRCGENALVDAVNRMKVFLALNEQFCFTSVDDMFHRCYHDAKSAKAFERIFLKYMKNVPVVGSFSLPRKGSVYSFFELPKPNMPTQASREFERAFRRTVFRIFGVHLMEDRRDLVLYYRRNQNNIHNVLLFAKLLQEEITLKRKISKQKRGYIRCNRLRRRFVC